MGKDLKDLHNQGQSDRANGNGYNTPNGFGTQLTNWGNERSKEIAAENNAYNAGWRNADKQSK